MPDAGAKVMVESKVRATEKVRSPGARQFSVFLGNDAGCAMLKRKDISQ
jgi:hypothetical protein